MPCEPFADCTSRILPNRRLNSRVYRNRAAAKHHYDQIKFDKLSTIPPKGGHANRGRRALGNEGDCAVEHLDIRPRRP